MIVSRFTARNIYHMRGKADATVFLLDKKSVKFIKSKVFKVDAKNAKRFSHLNPIRYTLNALLKTVKLFLMDNEIKVIKQENFKDSPFLNRLNNLHKIPEEIYIKGNIPEFKEDEYGRLTPRVLAIVGSRKNTSYGEHVVKKLVASLSSQNVIILSGLAYGIDEISHNSAINNNLKTIAIPGSGLNREVIYPKSNQDLADEIVEKDGLLISELSPDTKPDKWTFPARNRLVATLSDAILIIEASDKSGALITARQALELGKDIGAVPGEIFSDSSLGTNMLIKDGASIITNEDDLYDLLHLKKESVENKKETRNYTGNEKIIMDLIEGTIEKDILLIKSGMSPQEFLSAFSSLEISGEIEEEFGEVRKGRN